MNEHTTALIVEVSKDGHRASKRVDVCHVADRHDFRGWEYELTRMEMDLLDEINEEIKRQKIIDELPHRPEYHPHSLSEDGKKLKKNDYGTWIPIEDYRALSEHIDHIEKKLGI